MVSVITENISFDTLGTLSYNAMEYHNGIKFSTIDQDNDLHGAKCATLRGGGWWFKRCENANFNSGYNRTDLKAAHWKDLYKVTAVQIKLTEN